MKQNPQDHHDFSFGSKAWNEYYHGRNKDKKRAKKPKATAKQKRIGQAKADEALNAHLGKASKARTARFARILGPTGKAHAVKVSNSNLEPFAFQDVDQFRQAGWEVVGASQVAARNPAPLGSQGLARALVILGPVNRELLEQLEGNGLDVAPAPKAYREGLKKNPAGSIETAVYSRLKAATKKGEAWNALELSEKMGVALSQVEAALGALQKKGFAHESGRDLFGPVFAAGSPARGLFDNPKGGTKARQKAQAWYGRDDLVTEPKPLKIADNLEFVEVGPILAVEYESNKFDGKKRAYRHDVTHKRIMHISTDGTVIIIKPGFTITKRGIEG